MSTSMPPPAPTIRAMCPQIHAGQAPLQHLLDLELSVGSQPRHDGDGQSLLDHDRSSPGGLARVRDPGVECKKLPAGNRRHAGAVSSLHLSFQKLAGEPTGHPVAVFQRIDQAGYKLPIDERILEDTDTLMVFGLDHLASEQEAAPEEIEAIREWLEREGNLPDARAASRRRFHRAT